MSKESVNLVIISSLSFFLNAHSFAAIVPLGTKLAKHQNLNKDNSNEISSLDPTLSSDNLSSFVIEDLFEGLVVNNSNGEYVPGTATSWSHSNDGLVYTFNLRKDAKWSDGKNVVAEDFVYSYRRLADPKSAAQMSYMIDMIKNANKISRGLLKPEELGIKSLDSHTLQITLENPTPYFAGVVSIPQLIPLRKDIIEKYGSAWTQAKNIVSNGAYILKSWKVSDKITLERNQKYWDNKNTVIETVNYLVVPDKTASLRMYQAGQLDWTYSIPAGQFTKIKKDFPYELRVIPSLTSSYLMFNIKVPPLDNPKLRKALALAVDRNTFTAFISEKGERPLYDIPPIGINNYTQYEPEWAKLSNQVRISEAKKLYSEAGFSDKNPAKIKYSYATNETDKKYASALASMWEKSLGVKTELINEEWKVHLNTIHEKKYQVTLRSWQADYNDAYNFTSLLESNNPQNLSNYSNKEFDSMLAASNKEHDLNKRKLLLKNAMKVALEEYPVSPIFSGVNIRLIKPYVQGAQYKNPSDNYHTKDLYIVSHDGNS